MAALLLAWPWATHAHPHAWIDMRISVVFDEQDRITALRQAWRIDPFYSMVLLEEMAEDAVGDSPEEKMADIGNRMITNLEPYDYFTELYHGEERIPHGGISDHALKLAGGRLELSFTLHLKDPANPSTSMLRYAVFDPGYYIEMLHDDGATVTLEGASERCGLRIVPPRPDPALVARAAALAADQTAEPGLGRHFTERAEISCDPSS